jgi:g-D-glutamyl-meso-diaminopimelate peptidase
MGGTRVHRKTRIWTIGFLFFFILLFFQNQTFAASIVNPKQMYTYERMVQDIQKLAKAYPDLIRYQSIGKSEYGRDIYAVKLGKGEATVFINGAHHAREWITTNLNMYMIEQYAKAYQANASMNGYSVKLILDKTTIWFVPMVNPDGVTLQQFGLKAFPKEDHAALIRMNDGSKDFKRWKANGKGVDLNRQYNADWANICCNPGKPYYKNYKGEKPHSAAETKAIIKFVQEIDPEMAVSYHSSGRILYWNFHQKGSWYNRDHQYAKQIGKMTGYRLVYPGPNPSGGGFTDWFIITYKRPAFTPEVSRYYGETSPPLSEFDAVWKENKAVGLYIAQEGYKLYQSRMGSSLVNKANKEVVTALKRSKALRPYYTTNIQTTNDIQIKSSFKTLFDQAGTEIQRAQKTLQALPARDRERLQPKLDEAIAIRLNAARFIDGVMTGEKLLQHQSHVETFIQSGQLTAQTVNAYNDLSAQIRKAERVISRVYSSKVRQLMTEKYIIPAKITKETVIYEISRYLVLEEMEALLAEGNVNAAKEKFAVLERLEARSIAVKEEGNRLHPGKYPDLPQFEQLLKEKKQAVEEQLFRAPEQEARTEQQASEHEMETEPSSASGQVTEQSHEATQALKSELPVVTNEAEDAKPEEAGTKPSSESEQEPEAKQN